MAAPSGAWRRRPAWAEAPCPLVGASSSAVRGRSSAGRAAALQAAGRRFDPDRLHHRTIGWSVAPWRGPPVGGCGVRVVSGRKSALPRGARESRAGAMFDMVKRRSAGTQAFRGRAGCDAALYDARVTKYLIGSGLVGCGARERRLRLAGSWLLSRSGACFRERTIKRQEGHLVDALVPRGDEGRDTLRKATGSREWALIRGYPNGETRPLGVIRS